MIFKSWFWHPFASHFEGFWEPKWRPRPSKCPFKKRIKKRCSSNWSQKGSQKGDKIVNNGVLEAPCFKGGSQVVSRAPPGSIWDRCWDHFWIMFVIFSKICVCDFCTQSLVVCYKQTCSKSQEVIKRMQQRASKKQLLSSSHLALNSSLANVNELSGPC